MKFQYEIPCIERKQEAIDFVNEFYEYGSEINGVGGLKRYLNNYEGWLQLLKEAETRELTEEKVPSRTYFLVRCEDNRIVGMANIRTKLNQKMMQFGGNIGYSIRPTERKKGYNKINLYLALKVCSEYGIATALLDADADNIASWKTMEALGGCLLREESVENHKMIKFYTIDVEKSLKEYRSVYEPLIKNEIAMNKDDSVEL